MREPLFPSGTKSADSQEDDEVWVLDSSVRKHSVRCKKLLSNTYPCFGGNYKEGFSGMTSPITQTGDAFLPSHQGRENLKLLDVSCVPESVCNLISVSKLTTNFPFCVIFNSSGFVVKNLQTKKDIAKGHLDSNQYLWPRKEPKPKGGITSIFTSIHKQFMSSYNKELSHSDNNLQGLPLGFEFQEAWPNAHRMNNPGDFEHRDSWVMSSYATQHITYDRELLRNLRALPQEILFPDFAGRTSPATHVGEVYLQCSTGGQGIVLHEVLLVPDSTANYISVAQLTLEYPSSVEFRSDGFIVRSLEESRLIAAAGPKHKGLYMWFNTSKS